MTGFLDDPVGADRRGDASPVRFMVTIMVIVFAVEAVIMAGFSLLPPLSDLLATFMDATTLTLVAGAISWFAIGRPFRRELSQRQALIELSREEMLVQARSRDLDSAILRALDMAETEEEIIEVARHTLATAVPGNPGELLMADSSHAHLRLVADNPLGGGPGCSVTTPAGCPAVRRGHPLSFAAAQEIDACPRLRGRDTGNISAVCVPVALLGRATGVLHVTGAPGTPPTAETVERLRLLGAGLGSRLGVVRTLSDAQVAASTDPLTGLLNRRSLERQIAALESSSTSYAVVALDLDHFKTLNDTHGHLTGDQALRLFARVLRTTARTEDIIARLGGEEFCLVLPRTPRLEAASLADRVRLELAHALTDAGVPGFTVSAGVAADEEHETFEEVLAAADSRLYQAKQDGRDRVVST